MALQNAIGFFESLGKQFYTYNDWFFPSLSEMNGIYMHRVALGMTGFYWSSTEIDATTSYKINFTSGQFSQESKSSSLQVRPVRSFTTGIVYLGGDLGPAAGIITQVIDNGNGTYTYIEASLTSLSNSVWSNVGSTLIGVTAQTTSGSLNTVAIIGQIGHIDSAAKLCDDLIV